MINAVFYYWNKKTKESEKTTTFKINNNNYVKCEKMVPYFQIKIRLLSINFLLLCFVIILILILFHCLFH